MTAARSTHAGMGEERPSGLWVLPRWVRNRPSPGTGKLPDRLSFVTPEGSTVSRQRYQEKLRQRFPWFLSRWLAKLPAAGWQGTSRELWDAMESARRPFDLIPAPNALVNALDEHADRVAAAGFRVRARRTARVRLVVLERIGIG